MPPLTFSVTGSALFALSSAVHCPLRLLVWGLAWYIVSPSEGRYAHIYVLIQSPVSVMSTQHTQEPTGFSTTETVIGRETSEARPTLGSAFSGRTLTSTSPDPLTLHDIRQPPARQETLDPRLTPTIIPPEHPYRTLILCFDGTGDQFDADNSNIVQLVSLLKKNDRSKQMVYYQVHTTYPFKILNANHWLSTGRYRYIHLSKGCDAFDGDRLQSTPWFPWNMRLISL